MVEKNTHADHIPPSIHRNSLGIRFRKAHDLFYPYQMPGKDSLGICRKEQKQEGKSKESLKALH